MTLDRSTAPLLMDDHSQPDPGVKEVALTPVAGPSLPATAEDRIVSGILDAAKDPHVDPDKLEKLIALQERLMRHHAKAAFDAAFARMQAALPEVSERGRLEVKGTIRSRYAKLEDIQAAVRPVLKAHGFALRHRTEWPPDRPGTIRIVGILSHEQGHSEESVFEAPMDKSDYRTDIQSMGSTVSYGRRYTTIDLLNITTRGADDDGAKSGRPDPPQGYADWAKKLTEAAGKGQMAYDAFWECSDAPFKQFAMNHDRESVKALQARAAATGKGTRPIAKPEGR